MIFLDTNILLYTITLSPREMAKREIAGLLVDRNDCALSMQVLNEFVVQSTSSRRTAHLTIAQAMEMIDIWRRFPVQPLDLALFDTARDINRRTKYSWWDSLIVAAAVTIGCETLQTEDMQHGRVIDGVRIVNPFRELA